MDEERIGCFGRESETSVHRYKQNKRKARGIGSGGKTKTTSRKLESVKATKGSRECKTRSRIEIECKDRES